MAHLAAIVAAMFLRRNRRTVDGETYDYWTLVETVRTARGPRQQVVATLGKEPGHESRARHGWEAVAGSARRTRPGGAGAARPAAGSGPASAVAAGGSA